uniref:RING-type E3 ubiquitin transferase n=1 Tax=Oryza punctata TaxID=4537 RepID=A0A0E0L486_ORYPU
MSNRATHWCYLCRRPVRIRGAGQDVTCPSCDDGFVQEMCEMGRRTASSTLGFVGPDAGDEFLFRRSPVMEAMSTLMRHVATVGGDDGERDVHDEHGDVGPVLIRRGGDAVPEHARLGVLFRGGQRVGFERRGGGGGYYRAGLEALFEQLQNQLGSSRQGPPPASPSAIDAVPMVTISRRHLRAEPRCPVCQDAFQLGAEVRQMPCTHLYHDACIVPWLVQHNSCPVCRHPLPSPATTASGEGASGGEREARRGSRSFLWPFGPTSSRSQSHECDEGSSDTTGYEDPVQVRYIRWHYNH